MTSGTGSRGCLPTRESRPGAVAAFTLLEILTALLVIGIMTGVAVGLIFGGDAFQLTHARDDLVGMARRAARVAAEEGRDYTVHLKEKKCVLKAPDGTFLGDPISFPEGARVSVRQFGSKKFQPPGRDGFLWPFRPSGLSIPLTVRLQKGANVWEVDFGPLVGSVVETRSTSYR